MDPLPSRPKSRDELLAKNGRLTIIDEIHLQINEAIQYSFPPYLDEEELSFSEPVKKDVRNHVDADYMCYSILPLAEVLRSKHPCFKRSRSKTLAQIIMFQFRRSHIFKEVKLHNFGFLSFKLSGDWIAEMIRKNLKDGIAAWAPIFTTRKVLVDFPERHAGSDRGTYIRDTLVRLYEYSGVEVCRKIRNEQSLQIVKSFPEDIQEDLMALWCGEHVQKANVILYLAPVRQREYILKCFAAAAKDLVNEKQTSMVYLGYQTSSDEIAKLDVLRKEAYIRPGSGYSKHELLIGKSLGYGPEAIIECIIRYQYLKKYTYSDCSFEVQEIFGTENTFLNLLKTRDEIREVLGHSRPNLESNKTLVGREREVGLRLLQFTEIICESVLKLMPHLLCEYLYNLSEDFTSFIHQTEPSETQVLLCKAAEVVMEKGFDLLGITPESVTVSCLRELQIGEPVARDHDIALLDLWPNSRFEIFSMYVEVFPRDFKNGNLFGEISVSDANRAAHPDKWCGTYKNGWGKVAYFEHDWYDPISICSTSFLPLPFGDPASRFSLPFSTSIKIAARLWVTSEEKDIVYELCHFESEIGEEKFDDFLMGKDNIKGSTFHVESGNGLVSLHYFLIKEAVDTSISLSFKLLVDPPPRVRGHIHAYYGGTALDSFSGFNKNYYKAVIFHTEPTTLAEGNLTLKKSTLAVPKDGVLVFDAFFQDAETGKTIVKERFKYSGERAGTRRQHNIQSKTCCFILTVDWIQGHC